VNVAFLLTPKSQVVWVSSTSTLGQALERMRPNRYAAVPILDDEGGYVGTLTEGDALWHLLEGGAQPRTSAARTPLAAVGRRNDYQAVHIDANLDELLARAVDQNFVPVVDDREVFTGIVRRKSIIQASAQSVDMLGARWRAG